MSPRRRLWLVLAACLMLGGAALADGPVAPGGPDLKTTLEKGLKARRPVEFAFIHTVVAMVDNHELPRATVEKAFLWARYKRPYPYPYFERALREQAKKIGVSI